MKIALLGDVAPFGRFCLARNPNLIEYFSSVSSFLSQYDIVVGNLEAPFVGSEKPVGSKSAHVKLRPENIDLLKAIGITHVTLANNHIGDFGRDAYERTKDTLEKAGISWFGTEGRQVEVCLAGEKIALTGYCSYNTNPSPVKSGSEQGLNYLDVEDVLGQMVSNANRGYLTLLSVHSGQEHVHMPSSDDVAFARGLARKFDYIYYGHHPHVIQGHEVVGGSSIYYSLGNFIFDDVYTPRDLDKPLIRLSESNKTGAIGVVEVLGGSICKSSMVPVYLGHDKMLVGEEVPNFKIHEYRKFLEAACSQEYDEKRKIIIGEYISSRKEMRNIKWYINRLNLNSVGIIVKSRINARRYKSTFSSKLNLLEGDR